MTEARSETASNAYLLLRLVLFNKMRESDQKNLEKQIVHLKTYLVEKTCCPPDRLDELYRNIRFFVSDFKRKWSDSNRMYDRFMKNNKEWLETSISLLNYQNVSRKKPGRPLKPFEECSERSKRMKTEVLRSKYSSNELAYAAQMSMRSEGSLEAAKLIKNVSSPSSTNADQSQLSEDQSSENRPLTQNQALSMLIEAKLTRNQYNIIRDQNKTRFPSYKTIQNAKLECYPSKDSITVTDISAEVELQSLLDHTAERLLESMQNELESKLQSYSTQLILICKWGLDGSSQSEYKQKFDTSDASDGSIFMSSLVPLRLALDVQKKEEQTVIWQNDKPSSTRYCRPIKFKFEKETIEATKKEKDRIEDQITSLKPFNFNLNGKTIEIRFILLFTMIDGKVCNAVTETKSTQRCFICGLTSKDFNNVEKAITAEAIDSSRLGFGISPLHARIRFFEFVLHIAYKLPVLQWQVHDKQNKEKVVAKKKMIQDTFKNEMGLIIDKPKYGHGNTNDGNTARRVLREPEKTAKITGIDINILKRFKVILETISCGEEINVENFRSYCMETARLYVQSYPWYPMSPTVHKVLVHGADIVKYALVPIGQLSEEAQETRNKEFKKYREDYSRKMSRQKTNEDIFNLLLILSDPLITSLRKPTKRTSSHLDAEMRSLLLIPNMPSTTTRPEFSEESESSDGELDE